MYDYIYHESLKRAKHKVWIFSDLQQENPRNAKECLNASMEDYYLLGAPADMIWFLGDCVEGSNRPQLEEMCEMQEKAFVKTGIPLCFVAGNHDLDYVRVVSEKEKEIYIPFYEMAKKHKDWYMASNYTDPYFKVALGDFKIYFFTDHIAADRSWFTTHGIIRGDKKAYPHIELLQKIKDEMKEDGCPVITASHYSFPGGSRPSELFKNIMPLPQNVKLHFYGHAHIGDFAWAGDRPYQRISWMEFHDIPQINVSSFEHIRGLKCRSVFLHIYEDHSCGIFFRNHDDHVFTECYFPSKINYPHAVLQK